MKLFDSLRKSFIKEADQTSLTADFTARVVREKERLQPASAGRLDAEIRGLAQRLSSVQQVPEMRDLADLVALSAVLADRFNCHPLQRWGGLLTFQEAQLAFVSTYDGEHTGFSLPPGEKAWRQHVVEFGRAVHLGELFDDPLGWLIAWRPSEPREHATKVDVLKEADLGTLTNLLVTIVEWEIEQYASERPATEPDFETAQELWQGLSDTRAMRLAIVDAWCRHPRIPRDYAEVVRDAMPEKLIDFLTEKVESLIELGRVDALEKTGSTRSVDGAAETENRFSLYS